MKLTTKETIENYVYGIIVQTNHIPENMQFRFKLTPFQFNQYTSQLPLPTDFSSHSFKELSYKLSIGVTVELIKEEYETAIYDKHGNFVESSLGEAGIETANLISQLKKDKAFTSRRLTKEELDEMMKNEL